MTTQVAAQSTDTQAQAAKLFNEGMKLMKEGKFLEACTAFELSQSLQPNISTLMRHAQCREKNLQLKRAWQLFVDAERQTHTQSHNDEKMNNATAKMHAEQLKARLSTLEINVSTDQPKGLEIRRDTEFV